MPTEYTDCISKGVSFEEFCLGCARAFGALISMREDPQDAEIPDTIKPNDYYKKALVKAEEEKRVLLEMMDDRAKEIMKMEYQESLASFNKYRQEREDLKQRYLEMESKVDNWNPPTLGHQDLKRFMLEQIQLSTEWDCNFSMPEPEKPTSVADWKKKKLDGLEQSISYYSERNEEEMHRARENTTWIKLLKESLKSQDKE